MDKLTTAKIEALHPKHREEVILIVKEIGEKLTGKAQVCINESFRSQEYQDNLYALGRTKKNPDGASKDKPMGNIVTKAKGSDMSSFHNFGLALDICLIVNGNAVWETNKDYDLDGVADWAEVVKIFKKYGWQWGGLWTSLKDEPHFEKTFGKGWRDYREDYMAGKTFNDNGNKYVIIDPLTQIEVTTPLTKSYYVTVLQNALKRKGIPVTVDGVYGVECETIVKDFQKKNGLTDDGKVGNKTLAKLGII